jgi:CDP-2,3-bis-(O-geranylgeranyl)-sn-glycerol synthase
MKYWRGWNRPIDRARLGSHKTIVGFAFGVIAALLVAFFQSRATWPPPLWLRADCVYLGLAQGLGAMTGDAIKSYFKRRMRIAPGERWIPADQLDFVAGALLPTAWLVSLGWIDVVVILAITFPADIAVNRIAFRAGIRNSPW